MKYLDVYDVCTPVRNLKELSSIPAQSKALTLLNQIFANA